MPPAPAISRALAPFGTTIFTVMTRRAVELGAVNLAQGFPDFEGPDFVKDAAAHALKAEHNQYAPMPGLPVLRRAIAARFTRMTGLPADPDANVTVTSGCTEAIAASIFGLCNPGDEVVMFEPFYDSYRASVAMAGCIGKFVALRPQPSGTGFGFDPAELRAAFSPRTRLVLLNTPHNPTGKVFTRLELEQIAALCQEFGANVVADEVYERLVFDPARLPHIHIASLSGMAERTVTLSSLGKTFSLTGWKIGWSVAPAHLTAGIRAAHQFLTFSVPTPLQHAAAVALSREEEYVPSLVRDLAANRAVLSTELTRLGFTVHPTDGTYFIMADHAAISARLGLSDDIAFCNHLIENVGVAAIPPSVFYDRPALGRSLVRFAFCKKPATIEAGIQRLATLKA